MTRGRICCDTLTSHILALVSSYALEGTLLAIDCPNPLLPELGKIRGIHSESQAPEFFLKNLSHGERKFDNIICMEIPGHEEELERNILALLKSAQRCLILRLIFDQSRKPEIEAMFPRLFEKTDLKLMETAVHDAVNIGPGLLSAVFLFSLPDPAQPHYEPVNAGENRTSSGLPEQNN